MMEQYSYATPPGYGDTFYVYAYDSTQLPLVSGNGYSNQRVQINDGDFILRWWRGCDLYANISQGIQIRDYLQNQFWSANLLPFAQPTNQQALLASTGWPVLPEKWYPDSGYIGFDLLKALPNIAPNISGVGQLAFYGVRRRKGLRNDPQVYTYPSYEKVFDLQTTVTLPVGFSSASGGQLTALEVPDFDFEIRRVDGYYTIGSVGPSLDPGYCGLDPGQYKILLLDQNQIQISNVPLLFTNFFHVPDNAVNLASQSSAQAIPKNFWPTPPMTYRANTSIRFYIYVTSATPLANPVSIDITFRGIRRYPCK